jgi:hypothetical protein
VGGDSFVLLSQLKPVDITIIGYGGEPYLRFLPDGIVEENRRSPATYLNQTRFGNDTSALPSEVDVGAAPDWRPVASDGRYAWHDHRSHWMLAGRPFGLGPGDQILEQVIPIEVDGVMVKATVKSFWMPSPSPLPGLVGAAVGVAAAVLAWFGVRRWSHPMMLALLVAAAGVAAGVVGFVQYWSLPSETGPSPTLVALPTIGLAAAVVAVIARHRPQVALPMAFGGAVALLVFGAVRIEGITRAVLPTDLNFAADRFLTAIALAGSCAAVLLAAVELSRLLGPGPPAASPTGAA